MIPGNGRNLVAKSIHSGKIRGKGRRGAEQWARGKTLHVSLLYYRVQAITELHLMSMKMANESQSIKLLEESEDFVLSRRFRIVSEEDSSANLDRLTS